MLLARAMITHKHRCDQNRNVEQLCELYFSLLKLGLRKHETL